MATISNPTVEILKQILTDNHQENILSLWSLKYLAQLMQEKEITLSGMQQLTRIFANIADKAHAEGYAKGWDEGYTEGMNDYWML